MNFHKIIFIAVTVLICGNVHSYDIDEYADLIKQLAADPAHIQAFQAYVEQLLAIDPDYFEYNKDFNQNINCKTYSPSDEVPTSVNKLRPGDIKVVGAMGDSLTAAVGAKAWTILGLVIEYREVSWSIGGEHNLNKVATLPNIIKKFNPNLKGFSTKPTFVLAAKEGAGFNAAVSGNKAYHIIDQARILLDRMKQSKEINFEQDWKMVTLFIGGNDLCGVCKNKTLHSPQQYIDDIKDALDFMQKEFPRTIVNLINALNVAELDELNVGLFCPTLHRFLCPCAAFPPSKEDKQRIIDYFHGYSINAENLVKSGRYDTTDDFTVVYQPFFRDFRAPRRPDGTIDTTYFAPDCFHFSGKSQAMAGIALWNNMLEPVGNKSFTFDVKNQVITCPSEKNPYIFTNLNSDNHGSF